MGSREELEDIRAKLAAATVGPWRVRECPPCTERGRLEVNIWDEPGNLLITSWRDGDEYDAGDAVLIAAAPDIIARLTAAVEAVLSVTDGWEGGSLSRFASKPIRDAIESALTP